MFLKPLAIAKLSFTSPSSSKVIVLKSGFLNEQQRVGSERSLSFGGARRKKTRVTALCLPSSLELDVGNLHPIESLGRVAEDGLSVSARTAGWAIELSLVINVCESETGKSVR